MTARIAELTPVRRRTGGTTGYSACVGALTAAAVVVAGLVGLPGAAAAVEAADLPTDADVYLVSRTDRGASASPALTPDGRTVAYVSTADDLVRGVRSEVPNVFLATAVEGSGDPFSRAPVLVSRPDAALPDEPADDLSTDPAVSADGRFVAFVSRATNLVPGGGSPGRASVYVRDTASSATFRLDAGAEPNADSSGPDISDDGRFVVFASEATNLSPGDANGASDVFVADLDGDGDGVRGDVAIQRLHARATVAGGLSQPAISGNGEWVAFTAFADPSSGPAAPASEPSVFRSDRLGTETVRILEGAHDGAIDAIGRTFAAIVDDCAGEPAVVGASLDASQTVSATGVGAVEPDRAGGEVLPPVISADGSTIAWSSAQPGAGDGVLPELAVHVVQPSWPDVTPGALSCERSPETDTVELGEGLASGLSASGRTVALSGPSDMTSAASAVTVVDLHTNDGLAVSHTMRELAAPGLLAGVAVSDIPLAAVAELGSALATTPLSSLQVGRLPLGGLPLSRVALGELGSTPIPALPIHRADVPRGWTELFEPTEFAERLPQTVMLAEVLAWADAADGDGATREERESAERIRNLSIADVDLDGTGIDRLSMSELILGDAAADLDQGDVAAIPLHELPIEATPLDSIPIAPSAGRPGLFLAGTPLGALDVGDLPRSAQTALFGGARTGTLAENAAALLATATVADLALGAPDAVTVGTLLISLLDRPALPWERLDPAALPGDVPVVESGAGSCGATVPCDRFVEYRFTFDPGPGGPATFLAPTAAIGLPATTKPAGVRAAGSGPGYAGGADAAYAGPLQVDGSLVRLPLADTPGGTVTSVTVAYSASRQPDAGGSSATLTSGALVAQDAVPAASVPAGSAQEDAAAPAVEASGDAIPLTADSVRYGSISPAWTELDEGLVVGPAGEEDWYEVAPPVPGERLNVSANAPDGRWKVDLFAPDRSRSPLGVAVGVEPPGSGTAGHVLVDSLVGGGEQGVTVSGSSESANGAEPWLVRVASGDGAASRSLYTVRATYTAEPPAQRCPAWTPPTDVDLVPERSPDPFGPVDPLDPTDPLFGSDPLFGLDPLDPFAPDEVAPEIESDPVTRATNTVFVMDTARFRATHGLEATEEVTAAIRALDGTGSVGDGTVKGAILSVDTDPAVAAARTALDAQPCSVAARGTLAAAIIASVTKAIGGEGDHIASIVIVGGDDVIPFAPVAQHTALFTEAGHASELALSEQPDGSACPSDVAANAIDPCATPLSAAAAANQILTDDPYGLAVAHQTLGGYLYVPTVAVGRLVDDPDQIRAQLDRFRHADGILEGDSALSGGYGPWSELPQLLSENLAWRLGDGDTALTEPWTREDAESLLSPDDGEAAPGIIALGAHMDERRLVPGVDGAAGGVVDAGELIEADDHERPAAPPADEVFDPDDPASPLGGSVVLLAGGHAGMNLPDCYYDGVTDWADVFGAAGGFVGNTGSGLADDVTTALSERLFDLYTRWIGVETESGAVSSGGALTSAKQSYSGGLGLSTGYDEKAMMQAVYYGLPMYVFADSSKEPPLPAAPDLEVTNSGDGPASAELTLTPSFATITREDDAGEQVTYVVADGEQTLATAGDPLLPRLITQIPATDGEGGTPRGALITSLSSTWSDVLQPAVARPVTGVEQADEERAGGAFPSSFTAIGLQDTPDGPISLLVTTPASVQTGPDGSGRIETFPTMGVEVLYGSGEDSAPPVIGLTEQRGDRFTVAASDLTDRGASGDISRAVLLVQEAGIPEDSSERAWEAVELAPDPDGEWSGEIPADLSEGSYRWIVQVADVAGNVAIETAQGRIAAAQPEPPELGGPGSDVSITAGNRVVRGIPISAEAGVQVTGGYRLLDESGVAHDTGALTIRVGADGAREAVIDTVVLTPGRYTAEIEVCSGARACGEPVTFDVTVLPRDTAPTVTIDLRGEALEDGTLTAVAVGADPDEDHVRFSYRWLRNGVPIDGAAGPILDLTGLVQAGDVVRVVVVPNDGVTDGHAASATVTVGTDTERRGSPDR